MTASDRIVSDLIGGLYDAAIEDRLWAGMADRMAAVFGAGSAVIKMHNGDDVDLLETTANMIVGTRDRAWAEHWHRNDLWVERSVSFGLSRVITSQDLVSPEEEQRSGFYQEWLRHIGIHHMVGAVFSAGGSRIGVLGIHRAHDAAPFCETERHKAELLIPHLQRAMQLRQRLSGIPLAQTAALHALDRLDTGVVVVDRVRRIHHANARAENILASNPAVGVVNGRFFLRDSAANNRLSRQISEATATRLTVFVGSALAIPQENHLPLTLTITPLRPNWSDRDGQEPLALIFLKDGGRNDAVPDLLRATFGMTRSEAAIAADLARGWPPERICAAHGIAMATMRSHLKKILAKTGTRRQAEAVARITQSIPMLF